MKIQVKNYTLHSDGLCFYITERIPTGEKAKRNEYRDVRVGGYSTTIKNLVRNFGENELKKSDATSMEELLKDIERIMDDMIELNESALEADLEATRKKWTND